MLPSVIADMIKRLADVGDFAIVTPRGPQSVGSSTVQWMGFARSVSINRIEVHHDMD